MPFDFAGLVLIDLPPEQGENRVLFYKQLPNFGEMFETDAVSDNKKMLSNTSESLRKILSQRIFLFQDLNKRKLLNIVGLGFLILFNS